MATIIDTLLVHLDIDTQALERKVENFKNKAKATIARIGEGYTFELNLDSNAYTQEVERLRALGSQLTAEQEEQIRVLEIKSARAVSAIGAVQNGVMGLVSGLMGGEDVISFLSGINDALAELGGLAETTGQSTQDLQNWSNMAVLTGGSAEEMQQGIAAFQEQLETLGTNQANQELTAFFQNVGINVTDANGKLRSQQEIYLDLSSKVEQLGDAEFQRLAKSSGLNESQLGLITQGRTELEKMLSAQKSNIQITQQQADAAAELQSKWEGSKQSVSSLGTRILDDLTPAIDLFLTGLGGVVDFLQANRGFIYAALGGIAIAFAPAIPVAWSLATATIAATWPLIAIVAVVGFLINEFLRWKDGQDTVFGTLFGYLQSVVNFFVGLYKQAVATLSSIFEWLGSVSSHFDWLNDLLDGFLALWARWRGDSPPGWFDSFLNTAKASMSVLLNQFGLFSELWNALKKGDWDGMWSIAKRIGGAVIDEKHKFDAQTKAEDAQNKPSPKAKKPGTPTYLQPGAGQSQNRVMLPGSSNGAVKQNLVPENYPLINQLGEGIGTYRGLTQTDTGTSSSPSSLLMRSFAGNQAQAALGRHQHSTASNSVETNIGEVKVYTQATDAGSIARGLVDSLAFAYNTHAYDSGLS